MTLKKQADLLESKAPDGDGMIYQSITNGWQGLFDIREGRKKREVGRVLTKQVQQEFEDML